MSAFERVDEGSSLIHRLRMRKERGGGGVTTYRLLSLLGGGGLLLGARLLGSLLSEIEKRFSEKEIFIFNYIIR